MGIHLKRGAMSKWYSGVSEQNVSAKSETVVRGSEGEGQRHMAGKKNRWVMEVGPQKVLCHCGERHS